MRVNLVNIEGSWWLSKTFDIKGQQLEVRALLNGMPAAVEDFSARCAELARLKAETEENAQNKSPGC